MSNPNEPLYEEWFPESTYLCSVCKTPKVAKVIVEWMDTKAGNPTARIELNCGHTEKLQRVSKEFKFS